MTYMSEYMVHHLVTIGINKFMSRFMNLSYWSDIQIKITPWIQLVLWRRMCGHPLDDHLWSYTLSIADKTS